jgi:LuxR family maltose regulon positive regulatory protein
LARLLVAESSADPTGNSVDAAVALLDRLLEAADAAGRGGSVNEILVVQALAHHARGDRPRALAALARALVQTEPEGYVRLFLDEGAPMAALLREAAKEELAPHSVGRLLRAFSAAEGTATPSPRIAEPSAGALSERELQVLRLLKTELTGPEMARDLFVSLNTVRTHIKHIFAKLEVSSRATAVRRGQERGLI